MQPALDDSRLIDHRKLSDTALVSRATSGDSRALDVLVARHAPRVQRLATQLVGDIEDARDAAQESLVKLCVRLRQFRGEAQFTTWLHRLVVNTCRDLAERQRARQAEPLELEERAGGDEDDPVRLVALGDLRRDLRDALARLSAEQRAAVLLRDGVGLSYEEIARLARIPVGTAKSYVHRGRTRLRSRLEEGRS